MNKKGTSMTNALQAVLYRAAQQQAPAEKTRAEPPAPSAKPARRAPRAPARAASVAERPVKEAEPAKHYRPVRDGKRFVGAHFHPEVARQLKMLAAEDGTTIQELLEQAVDLLFVKNGRSKIGELIRKG
jgi:hypothetical protein